MSRQSQVMTCEVFRGSDGIMGVGFRKWRDANQSKTSHMHTILLLWILSVEKKSGSTTIYHSKYPNSSYILITTVYYKNIFIVLYFFFYMVIFLVIYILLLEFHIFLISKLIFLEISSLKLKSVLEPIALYAHMKQFLPLHLFFIKSNMSNITHLLKIHCTLNHLYFKWSIQTPFVVILKDMSLLLTLHSPLV